MKRIHRLRLIPVALVVFGAALPTAVSQAAPAASAPRVHAAAGVTLRFATFFDPNEKKIFNSKILPAFQKEFKGVTVNLEPIPDTRVKSVTQIAAGTAADVFNLGDGDVGWYADKGALVDLVPLAKQQGFSLDQYLPGTLTIGKVGNHQYSLPKDYSPLAIYYNIDMFKAAGLALPKAGWTWDEFRQDAIKLTKNGVYGASLPGDWPRAVDAVIRSLGGQLDSPDGKKVLGYMNSPATIKAVQFWIDLFNKDKISPTPSQAAALNVGDLFASGKAAMNLTGVWPAADYKTSLKFHWGVAPLPTGTKRVNTICYAGFAVSKSTKHPREAFGLVKYASGPVGDAVWQSIGRLPALKSVIAKANLMKDPVQSVFLREAGFIDLPEDTNGPAAAQGVGDTLHEGLTLLLNTPGTSVAQVLQIEAKKGQKAIDAYYSQ